MIASRFSSRLSSGNSFPIVFPADRRDIHTPLSSRSCIILLGSAWGIQKIKKSVHPFTTTAIIENSGLSSVALHPKGYKINTSNIFLFYPSAVFPPFPTKYKQCRNENNGIPWYTTDNPEPFLLAALWSISATRKRHITPQRGHHFYVHLFPASSPVIL